MIDTLDEVLPDYSQQYYEDIMSDLQENPPFTKSMMVRVFSDVDRNISLGIGRVVEVFWIDSRGQHLCDVAMPSGLVYRVFSERLEQVSLKTQTVKAILRWVK